MKVEKLLPQGLMTEAGLAAIETAKKNGKWNALDEVEDITIAHELQEAFDKNKTALENWDKFPRSLKRGILEWISNANRHGTRQK